MKGLRTLALAVTFVCGSVSAARATTIDFSGFASGGTGLSHLVVGAATIDITGGTVFVYRPGDFGAFTDSGGLCALSSGCETDWKMTFAFAVTNLVFEAAFYDDFDSVLVSAFNGATLLGSVSVTADGTYGFGGASVTSLSFDDSSTGAGFGFGDFRFDRAETAVPEPGTLLLLGTGLFGLARRRRRS